MLIKTANSNNTYLGPKPVSVNYCSLFSQESAESPQHKHKRQSL